MPLATTLFVLALWSVRDASRGNWLSPFLLGFEAFGWLAVFVFVACSSIIPLKMIEFEGEHIGTWTRPVLEPLLENAPPWVGLVVELGGAMVIFSLPELLLALAGGIICSKLGLTLRFGRHEWSADDGYGTSHDAGVKGPSIEQRRAVATSAG